MELVAHWRGLGEHTVSSIQSLASPFPPFYSFGCGDFIQPRMAAIRAAGRRIVPAYGWAFIPDVPAPDVAQDDSPSSGCLYLAVRALLSRSRVCHVVPRRMYCQRTAVISSGFGWFRAGAGAHPRALRLPRSLSLLPSLPHPRPVFALTHLVCVRLPLARVRPRPTVAPTSPLARVPRPHSPSYRPRLTYPGLPPSLHPARRPLHPHASPARHLLSPLFPASPSPSHLLALIRASPAPAHRAPLPLHPFPTARYALDVFGLTAAGPTLDLSAWSISTALSLGCQSPQRAPRAPGKYDHKHHVSRGTQIECICPGSATPATAVPFSWTKSTRKRVMLTLTDRDNYVSMSRALKNQPQHQRASWSTFPSSPESSGGNWSTMTKDWVPASLSRIGSSTELPLADVACKIEHTVLINVAEAYIQVKIAEGAKAFEPFRVSNNIALHSADDDL
ncbi:hypothetical protein DFH09DRAFT_1389358 [Mycena vulgaris]|nr:hypothetical protein DFH09DRAFT_1389358 [Mycena vulgaris]